MRIAAIAVALCTLLACNSFRLGFGTRDVKVPLYVTPNPSLIEGDATAGRRAFIDLKCIDCHRVAEDPHLPMGASALAGPMLAKMNRYSGNDLAILIRQKLWFQKLGAITERLLQRSSATPTTSLVMIS